MADDFTKTRVLLVEGVDEGVICEHLLQTHLGIAADIEIRPPPQNVEAPTLSLAKAWMKASGIHKIQKLYVVVDAEENRDTTVNSWEALRKQYKESLPALDFDFLILPHDQEKGSLESVFLAAIPGDQPIRVCLNGFMDCAASHLRANTQAQKDKFALITYINAHTPKPYSRVGVAIQQKAKDLFDYSHTAFTPLTTFLQKLASN